MAATKNCKQAAIRFNMDQRKRKRLHGIDGITLTSKQIAEFEKELTNPLYRISKEEEEQMLMEALQKYRPIAPKGVEPQIHDVFDFLEDAGLPDSFWE